MAWFFFSVRFMNGMDGSGLKKRKMLGARRVVVSGDSGSGWLGGTDDCLSVRCIVVLIPANVGNNQYCDIAGPIYIFIAPYVPGHYAFYWVLYLLYRRPANYNQEPA